MSDHTSSFSFYSFGIVVADKIRGSFDIQVTPIEKITLATGQNETVTVNSTSAGKPNIKHTNPKTSVPMGEQKIRYDVSTRDHKNISRSQSLEGGLWISAKWTAFGQSNRMTPPDVIKGETVMIFSVSDTDEFYWTSLMNEPSIRRQETVCYMFGNIPSGLTAFSKDTAYWAEVSTHDKYVRIHTAKNDGEPAAWDILLDTAKGTFQITDNIGNDLTIDSQAGTLTGNFLTSVTLKSPNMTLDGNVHITGNLKTDGNETTGGSSSTGGSASVGGSASIGGGVSVGAGGGGGDMTIAGNVTVNGNINGTGSLHMNGSVSGSNI